MQHHGLCRWKVFSFINIDAALISSSKRMGAGVVIRDHRDECVADGQSVIIVMNP
jgi:hypothetical protein